MTDTTSSLHRAPRAICPICGHDDNVTPKSATSTGWIYSCSSGPRHPDSLGPFEFPGGQTVQSANDGIMDRLGLLDDLLRCLKAGEPWVEHAIVEYRFKVQYPNIYYKELLPMFPHRTQQIDDPRTVSRFIAQALRRLQDRGDVMQRKLPGTGCYDHLNLCGYWALPSAPAPVNVLTWAEYAIKKGLTPEKWDLSPPASAA